MYSLNVPVPGQVRRLAADLHPHLVAFDRVREQHTLVCKRLGDPAPSEAAVIQQRVRRALDGTAPFAARIATIDYFELPTAGPGPVVYFAVESPGLRSIHERLCEQFDPVEDVEGEAYVPHVTLARGGTIDDARALADQEIDPIEWTVDELAFWDHDHGGEAGQLRLPV